MNTYVTLCILLVIAVSFCTWLVYNHYQHEKKFFSTLNEPLDNKGKWWYN